MQAGTYVGGHRVVRTAHETYINNCRGVIERNDDWTKHNHLT